MKRLFAVFTLCATTLIAAGALSGPAAADGRHDGRRHTWQSDRQTSHVFTNRGAHRQTFRDHRGRRYYKFQRQPKRHRHAYGYRHQHGYGYGPPRHRRGYRMGPAYAHQLTGARLIFRFD